MVDNYKRCLVVNGKLAKYIVNWAAGTASEKHAQLDNLATEVEKWGQLISDTLATFRGSVAAERVTERKLWG